MKLLRNDLFKSLMLGFLLGSAGMIATFNAGPASATPIAAAQSVSQ
jgi:hypothetical protein